MLAERTPASPLLKVVRFDVVSLCAEGVVVVDSLPRSGRMPRRFSRHGFSFRVVTSVTVDNQRGQPYHPRFLAGHSLATG